MKKITLKEAVELLYECSAVITEDYTVTYPSVFEDEEVFLIVQWDDEDGQTFSYNFNKADNQEVEVELSNMYLTDVEGASMCLMLLTRMILD